MVRRRKMMMLRMENIEEDDEKNDNVAEDEVEDDDVGEAEVEDDDVEDDDVKGEEDDVDDEEENNVKEDDNEEKKDPKTGTHTLCEPAQSKCTRTCHQSHFCARIYG